MLGSGATKKVQVYKGQTDRRQCERCELGCESRGPELRMDEEKYEMRQDVVEPEMRTRTQNTDMKLCTQGFFFFYVSFAYTYPCLGDAEIRHRT